MIEKISEEELAFCEDFCDPIAFSECMFSDFDNLQKMTNEFGHIRNGQIPMLSYEYLVDENPELSRKENFKVLERSGNLYNLGARRTGKTLVTLLIDMFTSAIHHGGWKTIFSSYDAVHIRKVLEIFIPAAETHPFIKAFKPQVKRSPTYYIRFKNGFVMESVNQNVASKSQGDQYFGHHVKKLWIEEFSKESLNVEEKRIDAISELGCIYRFSGMTNFTKYSPAGKIFYDLTRKNWLCNFPQYINPTWDTTEKAKAIKRYSGESSVGFRVFVKGEIVEDSISVFDMSRVRLNYLEDRKIKHLEIAKNKYSLYKEKLIVERPKNAEILYMAADIGESAPTEIIVISKVNEIYRYLYNITLYNLTDREQTAIFKHLAEKLKVNFIGLDTSEGTGRTIYRNLEEVYDKEHLCWVSFQEKLPVGFAKDDNDNVIFKDGRPVYQEEYVSEWSIKHLKDLLYGEKIQIPLDHKLDTQLNSIVSTRSVSRTLYECLADEDHLFSAFCVFSISEWRNAFNLINPITVKKHFKGGC